MSAPRVFPGGTLARIHAAFAAAERLLADPATRADYEAAMEADDTDTDEDVAL